MKTRVDYSRIARRYDRTRRLYTIPQEPLIDELCRGDSAVAGPDDLVRILDIACGTGNWLEVQQSHHASLGAEWVGLDSSPEMLAVAAAKLKGVKLTNGTAEALPFDDDSFSLAACSFAVHHFDDRRRFPTDRELLDLMHSAGFRAEITVTVHTKPFDTAALLAEAHNRDMSQLNLISDSEYRRGIEQLQRNPKYIGSIALLRCVAYCPVAG